ncbi:hypothetical protein PIB30_028466 [Stylosanthes scabra]|uniref:Glycosyltransferase 61 catalytic domain-containing protein n=1 Tax=Stylosanthes scabra TaxID=79078 RepID=A0ABU6Y9F6_9FABA|nr:hypothetical protein [Stylosanthes scabra]
MSVKTMNKNSRNWRGITTICLVLMMVLVLVFEIKYSMERLNLRHGHGKRSEAWVTKTQMDQLELNTTKQMPTPSMAPKFTCDRSHYSYDICTVHVSAVLDPTTSTFFVQRPTTRTFDSGNNNPTVTKIRPYPRKFESFVMSNIKELTIKSTEPIPSCHVTHKHPALVFSAGGYTGNFFHDFNDGFIPLYITLNSMFQNQDDARNVILVISKARDWWVKKYANLLGQFSNHPIIDLDNENNTTHCFPFATIGLVSHGFMTINPQLMPKSKSLQNFHSLLSKAYGPISNVPPQNAIRPRLVLVNRSIGQGRSLLNLEEVKLAITKQGFDVIVFEPKASTPLSEAFERISSSHVMVGVHGAALTHSLFLRPGSVFIQVVPLGAESVANLCFGNPARVMGLEYLEYRIRGEESSLIEKYGEEDMVIKDPVGFLSGKPWSKSTMDIYLKEQNVRLDLVRFRKCLKIAYMKASKLVNERGY